MLLLRGRLLSRRLSGRPLLLALSLRRSLRNALFAARCGVFRGRPLLEVELFGRLRGFVVARLGLGGLGRLPGRVPFWLSGIDGPLIGRLDGLPTALRTVLGSLDLAGRR